MGKVCLGPADLEVACLSLASLQTLLGAHVSIVGGIIGISVVGVHLAGPMGAEANP